MKRIIPLLATVAMLGCPNRPAPAPAGPGAFDVPAGTTPIPNRVVNGPVPGCIDAFELVGQTLSLPASTLTFDVGGIIDRIGITIPARATYAYSTRPVSPVDCSSTTLPALAMPTVTFGLNYLGDFSRVDPLCMNASNTVLTSFSVTGTPADALVEGIALDEIWRQTDRTAAARLHTLHNGGAFPATASPQCANWVDLATL
jgi:hypothetical protein